RSPMSSGLPPRRRSYRRLSARGRDRGRFARRLALEALEQRLMLTRDVDPVRPLLRIAPADATHVVSNPGGLAPHEAIRERAGHERLSPADLRHAPSAKAAFAVPGAPGQVVQATFTLTRRRADYRNEVGLFLVDDAAGRVGPLSPGDPGYAAAAL